MCLARKGKKQAYQKPPRRAFCVRFCDLLFQECVYLTRTLKINNIIGLIEKALGPLTDPGRLTQISPTPKYHNLGNGTAWQPVVLCRRQPAPFFHLVTVTQDFKTNAVGVIQLSRFASSDNFAAILGYIFCTTATVTIISFLNCSIFSSGHCVIKCRYLHTSIDYHIPTSFGLSSNYLPAEGS